jgi:general bacterial porin, GBP family
MSANDLPVLFTRSFDMKKSLIAIGVLAALANVAYAEDGSVQLYGILDLDVATQNQSKSASDSFPVSIDNNSTTNNFNNLGSFTGMTNGGLSDSRWGIQGKYPLENGLSATFQLESGFNLPTGQANNAALSQAIAKNASAANPITNADSSLSGQLFNRTAHIGFTSTEMGSIDFGRNYAVGYDVIGAYDPQKGSQLFSPLGFSGSQGGALGYTELLRNDNSIKYSNKVNGVIVRAIYKFGNQSGQDSIGSGYGLNIGYETDMFGVQAAYSSYTDVLATSGATFSATNPQGVAGTLYNTEGFVLGAKYSSSNLNVKAGYEEYKRMASTHSAATVGSLSEFGYQFAYSTSATALNNLTSYSGVDKVYTIYWVGGDYKATDKLNVSLAYYNIGYNVAAGVSGGTATQNFYSALLDYNLSKNADVYTGVMYQNDTFQTASVANPNITTVAVGFRYRFSANIVGK